MAITTRDDIIDGLGNSSQRLIWDKTALTGQTIGGYTSLWRATGKPGQPPIPTTARLCDGSTVGGIKLTDSVAPAKKYLGWHSLVATVSGTGFEIHDRLADIGGFVSNVTTSQTVNLDLSALGVSADRLGDTDYSDVQWWVEFYTTIGATGSTMTINVTYDDNSTGNVTLATTSAVGTAGRIHPIQSAVAGRSIKAVNTTIHNASTGTAGNYGFTATRQRAVITAGAAGTPVVYDWARLGLPDIANGVCLFGVIVVQNATPGQIRGQGKVLTK